MKILFIGNSYTFYNDMPAMFEKLANANGHDVSVFSVTKGGRKLIAYKDNEDPVTQKLDDLLKGHHFDVCFIQEQSVLPAADFQAFMDGVDFVVEKVKNFAEKLILYATWGRKDGCPKLEEHNWTTESMTKLLSDAYSKAARSHGAIISPVGDNFLKITTKHPEIDLYNADLSHPSYLGSCLAALTHYFTVFNEFPESIDCLSLSDDTVAAFRAAVL
ncbi:MAG: hypothetical protein E7575_08355 [Ruminococcaceae bacterium]|nr:hypothetical protein [Oscillospiraceae bacterium]